MQNFKAIPKVQNRLSRQQILLSQFETMKSVFVVAFLLCIHAAGLRSEVATTVPSTAPTVTSIKKGVGLKCYRCSSTKDWDECADIQEEYDCPDDENQCYQLFYNGKKQHVQAETYIKGCTTSDKCKSLHEELCKMEDFEPGIKCEISWCTGDLCNAGALPVVSATIFIACACLAFLY